MNTHVFVDKAKSIRDGESLNVESVNDWLKNHVTASDIDFLPQDALQGIPNLLQYSGGASNWTYCLKYKNCELILRRAPAGTKAKGAHDMGREFRIQRALKPYYPYVPKMIAFCDDPQVIGAEFYIMEKITGIIPRKNLPRELAKDPKAIAKMCRRVVDSLIDLHQVDVSDNELVNIGKGEGYIERQVEGWINRFEKAKTWNVPHGDYIKSWLRENRPTIERTCLIHNDFRFDNVVLDPLDITQIKGVLDWEMATLGDPLMDLGNTLAYWVEKKDDFLAQMTRRQPTHLDGMMTRDEVINYYLEKTGIKIDNFQFYEVYGLYRLAVIIQQIYFRYYHKQTRNPAFKNFWIFVHYLFWRCKKSIKKTGNR